MTTNSNSSFGLSIRLCKPEELPKILEIRRNAFQYFAGASYSPREVETLIWDVRESELEEMIDNQSLFVAEKNGKVVGCGGWLADLVRHMYVSPEVTKQGIGSALLNTVERDYKERANGLIIKAGVVLYAKQFYEKNGFELLGEAFDWDGSRYYRMQKKLS